MNIRYSQGRNDCVIVSIANFLDIDYDDVIAACENCRIITRAEIQKGGLKRFQIEQLLKVLRPFQVWQYRKPRRGQEKLVGLVRFHINKNSNGHMAILNRGIVIDTDGWRSSLAEYRLRWKMSVISGVWVKVN